jgi:16S rRNA (uracil1498-N3)-methyltransferase
MITVLAGRGTIRAGATVTLDDDERHHLRVRRVTPGTPLRLLDGAGGIGEGELSAEGGEVLVDRAEQVEPPAPLQLIVAAGDRERFSLLAEKCAELGVTELIPAETERTRGVATRVHPGHIERIRRRALEAIKQSGCAWAPAVSGLTELAGAIGRTGQGPRWLADGAGESPAGWSAPPVAVAVGPEGGFTADEHALLVREGFRPVRLGPHVLRFETAAIAAAVVARLSFGGRVHE